MMFQAGYCRYSSGQLAGFGEFYETRFKRRSRIVKDESGVFDLS